MHWTDAFNREPVLAFALNKRLWHAAEAYLKTTHGGMHGCQLDSIYPDLI